VRRRSPSGPLRPSGVQPPSWPRASTQSCGTRSCSTTTRPSASHQTPRRRRKTVSYPGADASTRDRLVLPGQRDLILLTCERSTRCGCDGAL
jgi:hypothetical protein